jgi:hypothetical protein
MPVRPSRPALHKIRPIAGQTSITLDTVEIISEKLDIARLQIQPSLGASTYYFGPEALESIPQGENAPLNQVLLQMPGVAQDSFGQVHVRGDHANVQFRINGVHLPEVSRSSVMRANPASPERAKVGLGVIIKDRYWRNAAGMSRTLSYQAEFTDLLKHPPKISLRRQAHGSISVL